MKILNFPGAEILDFGNSVGIAIQIENGKRKAVRISLPKDTEDLPELFKEAGKTLRDWARQQKGSEA